MIMYVELIGPAAILVIMYVAVSLIGPAAILVIMYVASESDMTSSYMY